MKRNSGFTLTELMVAIAIMSILMAIAMPAFVKWLPGYKMNSAIRDLYSHLQQAKMTAIKSNTQHSVVFGQNCDGTEYAYVVFRDSEGDFTFNCPNGEAGDTPLMISWEANAGFSLDVNEGGGDGISFADNDSGLPAVGFRSNGIPVRNGGGDPSGGVFLITDELGKKSGVLVSPAGSIRIE